MKNKVNTSKDIQAASKLTIEGVNGIVDIVEEMYYVISRFGGLLGDSDKKRTKGITGFVFKIIRSVLKVVGASLDILLNKLSLTVADKEATPEREAVVAVLNGVLGDYLYNNNSSLAIPMKFFINGKEFNETDNKLNIELKTPIKKVVIMIHGSCMNHLQWTRNEHNHGESLANELGYLTVYLQYNSGRHISENGQEFADLLEKLYKELSEDRELIIIAHSMGGLVSRSACYYAEKLNYKWINKLQKLIFLGTPHHGAPLERGGNWFENILTISPYTKAFFRLGKIRSAGITDLRYSNLLDEDWQSHNRFSPVGDTRTPVPLPEHVQCYTVAATINENSNTLIENLAGDGLVPVNSALGYHKNQEMNLSFPENNKFLCRNIKHLDLLDNVDVYNKIKKWVLS